MEIGRKELISFTSSSSNIQCKHVICLAFIAQIGVNKYCGGGTYIKLSWVHNQYHYWSGGKKHQSFTYIFHKILLLKWSRIIGRVFFAKGISPGQKW
jgi:hypothetical protein